MALVPAPSMGRGTEMFVPALFRGHALVAAACLVSWEGAGGDVAPALAALWLQGGFGGWGLGTCRLLHCTRRTGLWPGPARCAWAGSGGPRMQSLHAEERLNWPLNLSEKLFNWSREEAASGDGRVALTHLLVGAVQCRCADGTKQCRCPGSGCIQQGQGRMSCRSRLVLRCQMDV